MVDPGRGASVSVQQFLAAGHLARLAPLTHGSLKHEALISNRRDELEAAGPLEPTFIVPVGMKQAMVKQIEELTDISVAGIEA